MPERNGYKSHNGRSATARKVLFGGASGTNGIMPTVYVLTRAGKRIRTNYFGGPMKGGSPPSATGFMRANGTSQSTKVSHSSGHKNHHNPFGHFGF